MIKTKKEQGLTYFVLETANTSYVFSVTSSGLLLHNYYGAKVNFVSFKAITQKLENGRGTSVLYENNENEHLDYLDLETSFIGLGDYRENQISIYSDTLGYTNNFKYQGYEILKENNVSFVAKSLLEDETLRVDLFDEVLNCKIELYYKIFSSCDVISRYVRIVNLSNEKYRLERAFSMQLDCSENDFLMMTFNGAWSKERQVTTKPLKAGIYINDSKCGSSSNKNNPLVILKKKNTTENYGACYGFNLIYSGNHKTVVEARLDGKVRVLSGINDFACSFSLQDEFVTPEAILTFAIDGLNHLSQNMHYFVNNHIVRGKWKNKERPVLINNWEATYFKFDMDKLINLAKASKDVGIELFVLDDGWFGKRNDDTSSLGDYNVNKKKLPLGLKPLCDKINKLGMMFGLWVEPEMISIDSTLYKLHPSWSVKVPSRKPNIGRNQLVLDLTNEEVRNYIIESLTEVFSSCNLSYVKWDYNRSITDMYSSTLENQNEFFHEYIKGLYLVLTEINKRFPDILFEGCASGGARFDLGMLCFFPQIWTSDDTDYLERLYIQTGTSYGYPQSTFGCHVSDVPNHQTLRNTSLASRFNISSFGVLGYELDLTNISHEELKEIKEEISFYKLHRKTLQYGKFFRSRKTIFSNNNCYFWVVKDEAIVGFFQGLVHPNQKEDILYIYGLDEEKNYDFKSLKQKINLKKFGGLINMVSPIRIKLNGKLHNFISKRYKLSTEDENQIVSGSALKNSGIRLKGQFLGTGFNKDVRVLGDFGSRLYLINEKTKKDN